MQSPGERFLLPEWLEKELEAGGESPRIKARRIRFATDLRKDIQRMYADSPEQLAKALYDMFEADDVPSRIKQAYALLLEQERTPPESAL
jgi:hypothetical protein